MSTVSNATEYRNLLVHPEGLSNAGDLDLAILPLYDELNTVYYKNILEGFCEKRDYTQFWEAVQHINKQTFFLTRGCNLYNEALVFPETSLVFPAALLDPRRSCMTPNFPDTRLTSISPASEGGTVSYTLRLNEIGSWGAKGQTCSGSALTKIIAATTPAPAPIVDVSNIIQWVSGVYRPAYMDDAYIAVEDECIKFDVSKVEGLNYDPEYYIVIAVDKLQQEATQLKDAYGVTCIGWFCVREPAVDIPHRLTMVENGVYMARIAATGESLGKLHLHITSASIEIQEVAAQGQQAQTVDRLAINGSLWHITLVAAPQNNAKDKNILPSNATVVKIAIVPSASILSLPVKEYMLQDSLLESVSTYSISDVMHYGHSHYMTGAYASKLLHLPIDCISEFRSNVGSAACPTGNHLRLAVHIIVSAILLTIACIIIPSYIFCKWLAIRRLKIAAEKQEAEMGITIANKAVKTPSSALRSVIYDSQVIHAKSLDIKRKVFTRALSGEQSLPLSEIAAMLNVYPIDDQ